MSLLVAPSSEYSLLLFSNSLKHELLLLCIMNRFSVLLRLLCSIFIFVTYPVAARRFIPRTADRIHGDLST